VASREDIDAAGGVTRVGEETKISEGDRCLVCLSDYELGEECRTLSGCGHVFHKECIDQVIISQFIKTNFVVARFRTECMSAMSWCWRRYKGY
jgi:hypothetical protein